MTQLKNNKTEKQSSEMVSKKLIEQNKRLKKENEKLRKAHRELKVLFKSIDKVLYSVDIVSFKLLQISAACEKIYGYTVEEFFADGDLWQNVIHPEDKEIPQQVQSLNQGKQVVNQYRIIHKDKRIRWIENKLTPTLDENGRLIGLNGVTNDITDRKIAEKNLSESISILEATIESTADGILVADLNGKIIRFNKKFVELWQIPAEILETKDDNKAINYVLDQLADPEKFLSKLKELQSRPKETSFDILEFKDGRVFERYSQPQLINKECAGRVWSFRDITTRKKNEEALQESEKRFRQIIDLVPHFIFAKDAAGKFILANEAVAEVYGSTVEGLIGKTDADFNPNIEEVEHFIREDLKVINSGNTKHNIEETITDASGNVRVLSTTKIPYISLGLEVPGILGVCVDISERKKAEKIVKESESRLALATKIAKLGYWEFDAIKGLFTFNDQFYSLFKTTAEKVRGYIMDPQRYSELFVFPDDRDFVNAEITRTISEIDASPNNKIEHRIIYANGEIGWISVNFFLIKNDAGVTIKTFGVNQDITDYKKAEEALSNNELRFRTLTSNAPVGIFQTDINGKTSYVNETWLRYTGLEMNEALGDGWTVAVHPDDRNTVIEEWNNKSKNGLKSSSEYRLINKKGNIRWVSGEAIPLFNNAREITGYIGTLSDITDRKKADEALRLAQFTIENTTHAIYWIKSDGSFHMVNNAATQMLGFSFEELMQLNVPGIDPFYNKEVWDGFWQAIIQQKFMRLITKHIRKDGTLIDVQIDTHYFKFEDLEMSCAFVSDITERKIAETLLKNSEEKYRQIVETAQEGIWVVDENNETIFANKKIADMLEYSVDEMMGKQNYYFKDDEEKKNAREEIKRRKAGVSENHDAKFITKSGRVVWTNLSTNPVFDENGKYKGAMAMITDITERKLHHELLKKSEAELEIKNMQLELKNKELEQFAYVASHDLQEPLRTISSFVELLQQQYKRQLDEKADKYFNFILDASDRMRVLIKSLLDYSRIGSKRELEQVDCNAVLENVLADLHVAIQDAKSEITSAPLPVIKGFPIEIKQLFQNLLINAIKFRKKDTVPQIIISAEKLKKEWKFIFKDNGIGIAEEHREKIFAIFQRLHSRKEYEGSGIGLAHCKKIVELHGGMIWVESTPGNGSIFYFTVPASDAPATASKIPQAGIRQVNNIEYAGIKSTE